MAEREDFEGSAREFANRVVAEGENFGRLGDLLGSATVALMSEWAEEDPEAYTEAESCAAALGVDWPGATDDAVWQVQEKLDDWAREQGYGFTVRTLVRVELMGGGPAGWLEFTIDGREIVKGVACYSDWFMPTHRVELDDNECDELARLYSVDMVAEDVESYVR